MNTVLFGIFTALLFWLYRILKFDVKRLNILLFSALSIFIFLVLFMNNSYPYSSKSYILLNEHYITSKVSGKIVKVNVKKRDEVKAGELLFQLDTLPFLDIVNTLERDKNGLGEDVIDANIEKAQIDVENCSIRADVSGYVREINSNILDEVDSSSKMLLLIDEQKSEVVALFKKDKFSKISLNSSAKVSFNSFVGHIFDATVVDIVENIDDLIYDDLIDDSESLTQFILVKIKLNERIDLRKVANRDKAEVVVYEDGYNPTLMLRKVLFALLNWKNIIN
ncbi:MAG: biotin/lipoyl-binding protein [Campylobacterota bacterium]|nr:biotin/lipoyl-binding protein [Campylobacterota bacterium]